MLFLALAVVATLAPATLALATFVQAAQAQEPAGLSAAARQQAEAGVAAFKQGHYDAAAVHFQQAVEMAPQYTAARLYLATTYAQLYIPGANTPDNVRNGEAAIREFKQVVDTDDEQCGCKLQAMKGIASVYFNMKRLDDAAEWYSHVVAADPKDAEAYYSMGVIRWTEAYQPRMELRAKIGLKPTEPMPPGPECAQIRAKNENSVEDGMRVMKKALELRPDYDDAMAYMNLLYRERADYECDDPQARAADLKTADEWVDRTMAVKKAKAEHGDFDVDALSKGSKNGGGGGGGGSRDVPPRVPKR
jgi:tetratricopeptide (TPR) repeat protein